MEKSNKTFLFNVKERKEGVKKTMQESKRGRPKLKEEEKKIKKSIQMNASYWLILDSLGLARGETVQHLLDKYLEDEENNRN